MSKDPPTRDELLEENRRLREALARERSTAAEGGGEPGLFEEAFHLGPAGLAVSRLSDGAFIELNEQFLRLTGYDRDELIGHSALELGLWRSGRLRRVALGRLRTHGEILNVEFQVGTKTGGERSMFGSFRQLSIDGEECLLISCVDVSERLRAEASQRESEELFRRVFRLSPAGLTLSRLDDGRFVDVNPEYCRLAGYDRDELIGRTALEMGLWTDEERRAELVNRLESEGVVQDFEFAITAKDDWEVELMGAFQLLTVEGEQMILSVLSDISMRKRAERSLRKARQEAEELAQFRSTIISNITHEVRTPLTVILGFTSILREGVDGPYRRFVDLIERSGRRLLLTLDSVLDLAQLESGTLEINARRHNILDVVDSVANTTRPYAEEKELTFETDLPDEALYAEVDSELLSRALSHLVDNAIKFTDEGRIILRTRARAGEVLVEVVDSGIGIEEEFVTQLFDTFSQESSGMERDYQGSGMGLTVVSQLVERLGGEVQVESEKGEGSTFTVVLPEAARAPKENRQNAQVA